VEAFTSLSFPLICLVLQLAKYRKKYCSIRINTSPLENEALHEEAFGWTGLVNGWYNIITFLSAFYLARFASRFGRRKVNLVCQIMAGVGYLISPNIKNKCLLFVPFTSFEIAWASLMSVPYLLVVNEIPKEQYGVYVEIINMMIVIPMTFPTLSFGFISKTFLNNDPGLAISFAGVLLLLAALATLRIKDTYGKVFAISASGAGY